ncbi:MAG: UpxY family transcription antiterminator [Bacteroidales bacterium]|nr:UpxY family transcription antiterminator [Bacteroidales bacterium]
MSAEKFWYVGFVKSCQEKRAAEALREKGEEYFLPVQRVHKRWSDRMKWVDVLVMRGMIFLYITEKRRIPLLSEIYGLYGYMTEGGTYHPVTVPPDEMETFKFMLSQSAMPVSVTQQPLHKGEKVMVVRGPLCGLKGELIDVGKRKRVIVRFPLLGTASVEVPLENVERIEL